VTGRAHAPESGGQTHPGSRLAVIVALLAMLAPFSIDTYLPSFPDIAREFGVSALFMQQTLSFYLLAFAVMTLVYGPLADAFGRRVIVLGAVAVYVASSIGCWFAPNAQWLLLMRIGQGLSAAGGLVVGRAVIRDAFAGVQAQRVMSQMMLMFALAPAVAPIVGGWLHDSFGWRSVFVFLTLLGLGTWIWVALALPETLPAVARQSIHPRAVVAAYSRALASGRFMGLVAIVALNFGGFFLYIAASPVLIYRHLHFGANDFWRLFVPLVAGLVIGSFLSGRLAGRKTHGHAVDLGYGLMLTAAGLNAVLIAVHVSGAVATIVPPALYASGMSLAMPNLSLMALDLLPSHRGLASALQGFTQTAFNALVAGLLAPLLSVRLGWLAGGMLALCLTGFALWRLACRRHLLPASASVP
jgi:DHA1 family bicyclomycin/chloramphenicol resistance-like MFS transporter